MQPWEQFQQPAAQQPWEQFKPVQKDGGFISDAGTALTGRANELADNVVAYNNNEKSAPELAMNFLGKAGAGTANDLIGAGINAVTPDVVKRDLSTGAQLSANAIDSTNAGQFVGDKLMQARDAYSQFAQENPRKASALESFGNIIALAPSAPLSATPSKIIRNEASNLKQGATALADKYAAKYPEGTGAFDKITPKIKQPINQADAKNAVNNAYADVNYLGGQFAQKLADDAHSFIQGAKIKPFAKDILTKEDKLINEALSDYDSLAGKMLTLDDYRRLDSSLGDKAAAAFVSGRTNEGRIISGVQDKIRGMISPESADPAYFAGSKEGVEALTKDAIPMAAAEFKLRDLQKIADRAAVMDNPVTATRTGYRNLMLSKRFNSYPKNIQKLIVKAADTGVADDLLGIVGSRLNFIAGMAAGDAGKAALAGATSFAGRGIRNKIRNAKANKVMDSVLEPVRPSIEKYNFTVPDGLTMREMMKLPPAQARAALAKYKSRSAQVQP